MEKLIGLLVILFIGCLIILFVYIPQIFCFIKGQLNYILISASRARRNYNLATRRRRRELRYYANYRIKEQNKLIRRKEIVIDTKYDPVFDSGDSIINDNDLDYLAKILKRKGFTVVEDTNSVGQKHLIISWNKMGIRVS